MNDKQIYEHVSEYTFLHFKTNNISEHFDFVKFDFSNDDNVENEIFLFSDFLTKKYILPNTKNQFKVIVSGDGEEYDLAYICIDFKKIENNKEEVEKSYLALEYIKNNALEDFKKLEKISFEELHKIERKMKFCRFFRDSGFNFNDGFILAEKDFSFAYTGRKLSLLDNLK